MVRSHYHVSVFVCAYQNSFIKARDIEREPRTLLCVADVWICGYFDCFVQHFAICFTLLCSVRFSSGPCSSAFSSLVVCIASFHTAGLSLYCTVFIRVLSANLRASYYCLSLAFFLWIFFFVVISRFQRFWALPMFIVTWVRKNLSKEVNTQNNLTSFKICIKFLVF